MTKLSIRRFFFKPTTVLLVLFMLASTCKLAAVKAQEGGEHVDQQQEQEHHEPTQEEAPVEKEAPVQEEEAVREETPPVQEETPQEESPPDDSLFEIDVFECVAPHGDPAPKRTVPVEFNSILTLCIRPKSDQATLKSIALLDFSATGGPSQPAVKDNQAAGPMTRAICPMQDDPNLCIAATKLSDEFFVKSYNKASGVGQVVVSVAGEERTVPLNYQFSTAENLKPPPVEHDFFEFPATPPPFPCGKEIRIWMVLALILTLLEFAFSPDSEQGESSDSSGSKKKKKTKKEQ